ncbi:MAG: glutathione S-transferase family protein [Hyphomonadaceae bacterium]
MTQLTLCQFRFSPYNEKVRWALDLKCVPHQRRSLLPGPHRFYLRPRTGRTSTPALHTDAGWMTGSAAILDFLEARYPTPALAPAESGQYAFSADLERRFDEDWGPRLRRSVLAALLTDLDYLCRCFAAGKPATSRALYRATLPFAAGLIRAGNGIDPDSAADGMKAAWEALNFVEGALQGRPYLCGEGFSRADLVAASHLAVLCDPPLSAMKWPQPRPNALRDLCDRFADHAAVRWTLNIYARHRPAIVDFEGAAQSGAPPGGRMERAGGIEPPTFSLGS